MIWLLHNDMVLIYNIMIVLLYIDRVVIYDIL